jgi:hypothetical protein
MFKKSLLVFLTALFCSLPTNAQSGTQTLSYSSVLNFSSTFSSGQVTLTGNVSSFTISNGTYPGQQYSLNFCQDTIGKHIIQSGPNNYSGTVDITLYANYCTTIGVVWSNNLWVVNHLQSYLPAATGGSGASAFNQLTGIATPAQLPAATSGAQGAVQLPSGAGSNILGSAAMTASSAYDAANAATAALTAAETYSANASNLTSGTVAIARLPTNIPNTNLANTTITINTTSCALGSVCTIPTGSTTPALTYTYYPASVSDNGVAFAGGFTRYSSNGPAAGSVNPATSALGYLLFAPTPTSPQYAEVTVTMPPYWTSTAMYLSFYSTSISGNSVMDLQTSCTVPGTVAGSATFSSAITTTTAVNGTANGVVRTANIANIATPGSNGCPATGMTTPTTVTIRVYADSTSAVPTYLLGATLVIGRSQ